jgi:threonine dehydrogenase-like Zn-dependent dehydrogenase
MGFLEVSMLPGDIVGHEMMGEVIEVGKGFNAASRRATGSWCPSRSLQRVQFK